MILGPWASHCQPYSQSRPQALQIWLKIPPQRSLQCTIPVLLLAAHPFFWLVASCVVNIPTLLPQRAKQVLSMRMIFVCIQSDPFYVCKPKLNPKTEFTSFKVFINKENSYTFKWKCKLNNFNDNFWLCNCMYRSSMGDYILYVYRYVGTVWRTWDGILYCSLYV